MNRHKPKNSRIFGLTSMTRNPYDTALFMYPLADRMRALLTRWARGTWLQSSYGESRIALTVRFGRSLKPVPEAVEYRRPGLNTHVYLAS